MIDDQAVPLEERVDDAVRAAIAERRSELWQLVEAAVDVQLQELAVEVVAARLARNGGPLCSRCGRQPRIHHRTVCRGCLLIQKRELTADRRSRRLAAANGDGDDDERQPAAETAPTNGVVRVVGGVAADELLARARRARRVSTADHYLTPDELEAWLRSTGLADVTAAGLLVPTAETVKLAGALAAF